ncbi:hypothetical protein PHYBLDRAFT_145984 [Phycomyces blakesleeanus NRRL 1555(-)]|uniref:Uncharacterized protein n=1 Tax=Phycomyces blakesleeanus (strain ATCC 8743b / DSM 1359 / FGSC 10004 / NBRC 33097 / NRRL 1555) TaxID=763407 RepID=A0A163AD56_PHYB8|nr:hypothetical protein PHYBLDRAFT_145984 [Phycomyces blakesleeanus NRRL 1555(-)]OAD72671.1 hypothetical protein PHYBLDRAFT_145984 [Phycomyces blakesleeanus NRRL 1555(-)]|eukprot:XP_018290711.1 hypothetical protein PHYBLDRAFT_145984 [Phycomyces blakesleeanus NRRL 1555(-)]
MGTGKTILINNVVRPCHNVVCHCTLCSRNSLGYSLVSGRTAERHIVKEKLERVERSDAAERFANSVQEEEMMDVDTQYNQTDSTNSNAAIMADNVSVDDEISEVNDNDSESNDSSEEEDAETDIEELIAKDFFAASKIPANPVHQFIATFTVLFASHYVINKGAAVLIEFVNQLLKIYGEDFQLPSSLSGLQAMTGLSNFAKSIKKFVVCQDCYKVYKQDVPLPTNCDFTKHDARSTCSCTLMKVSPSGAMVAK